MLKSGTWSLSARDVVFIHKRNDWALEFPFALRSLKNLPHRKVWVFGTKPDWMTGVEHVPLSDHPAKWIDIHNKYVSFLTYQGDMTDEVVSMYDDTYILDDRYKHSDLPTFHWGTAEQAFTGGIPRHRLGAERLDRRRLTDYRRTIVEAGRLLEAHGIETPLNYALHVPFVFIRSKVPVGWYGEGINRETGPVQWRTMGGNTSGRPSTDLDGDVKVNRRVGLDEALSRDVGLLSTLNTNFRQSGAEAFLQELFPDPSPYET